jgi:hypothetical protein
MKALWRHELYVVIETHDHSIELEALDGEDRLFVSLADDRLIIDPTDGDLDEADALRNYKGHCCDCPHVTYFTVSVTESRHECQVCGETFIDPDRTKIYIHYKGSQHS